MFCSHQHRQIDHPDLPDAVMANVTQQPQTPAEDMLHARSSHDIGVYNLLADVIR